MSEKPGQVNEQPEGQHVEPEIMVDPKALTVDAEFQRMVPAHRKSELALLERSILEEKGCREALIVWDHEGKSILLDGHTRRDPLRANTASRCQSGRCLSRTGNAAKAYVKQSSWVGGTPLPRRRATCVAPTTTS